MKKLFLTMLTLGVMLTSCNNDEDVLIAEELSIKEKTVVVEEPKDEVEETTGTEDSSNDNNSENNSGSKDSEVNTDDVEPTDWGRVQNVQIKFSNTAKWQARGEDTEGFLDSNFLSGTEGGSEGYKEYGMNFYYEYEGIDKSEGYHTLHIVTDYFKVLDVKAPTEGSVVVDVKSEYKDGKYDYYITYKKLYAENYGDPGYSTKESTLKPAVALEFTLQRREGQNRWD